jgi:hypothetical protein
MGGDDEEEDHPTLKNKIPEIYQKKFRQSIEARLHAPPAKIP